MRNDRMIKSLCSLIEFETIGKKDRSPCLECSDLLYTNNIQPVFMKDLVIDTV